MADKQRVFTQKMTRNYIIALGILVVLSVIAFFIILLTLSTETTGREINISGRQRMLSQRVALLSLHLAVSDNKVERKELREELKDAINLMEKQHKGLINGSSKLKLPGELSPEVQALFFDPPVLLDKQVRTYIKKARNVLKTPDSKLSQENADLQFLIANASGKLLVSLEKVVVRLEREGDAQDTTLIIFQAIIMGVIILVIILEVLVLFRPTVRQIRQETAELENAYKTERQIANILQKSLTPAGTPKIEGLEVEFLYRSATERAQIGGDFYDFFELTDGRWGIIMGDVSGKGIDAAAETAKVKYLLRDRAYTGLAPDRVLSSINEALVKQKTEPFTALTYGVYDPKEAVFTFTNAGNPYPYITKKDSFINITSLPVAIFSDHDYPSTSIKFAKNETLVMFTDGLAEARKDFNLFGGEGVRAFIRKNLDLQLKELLSGLFEEAREFSGNNLKDDLLIVGLRKK